MASAYPRARIVDAPDLGATVLFDLHGSVAGVRTWPLADDWDLGAPELSGDPDSVGVIYGDRTVKGTLVIEGPKTTALTAQSKLARVLMRQETWLEFQLAPPLAPVWFRLRRPRPGSLSFRDVQRDSGADRWKIPFTFPAAPFAYGSRVTLTAVTIANDPAAGTNPVHVVLPAIAGDAPAPLRLSVNPSNPDYMNGYRWLTTMHCGYAVRHPVVWQIGTGDVWTAGADTAAPAAGSASTYSGGSYRRVSFATDDDLVNRVSGTAPTSLPLGRWKVLARVLRTDTDSTFTLRLAQGSGSGSQVGDTVVMDRDPSIAAGHATWVDLGEFTFPFGTRVPAGQEGVAYPPAIDLQVGRVSGAGSCDLDVLLLVPVDLADTIETRTLFSDFPDVGIFIDGGRGVWDGDWERFWGYTQYGTLAPLNPDLAGQFLRAIPGAENTLTLLQQVNGQESKFGDDATDRLTATTEVTISYQPQHLWIGDGS